MSNVILLQPALDPNVVLKESIGQFESVIVLGYDTNGCLDARASLNLKRSDILWIIEYFKIFTLLPGESI